MNYDFPIIDFSISSFLFICFLLMGGIQLLYALLLHLRFAFYSKKKEMRAEDNYYLPVTIIIAARNEEDNLFKNLPSILEQDYPTFEVLVVNHQSTDETNHILRAYQEKYKHLKVTEIGKNIHLIHSKKFPITIGVKGASYKHLVFTDADCQPASDQWLKLIAGKFDPKIELVLGYGPYEKKSGFLNTLIRFDTAFIASNYFSFALAKMPYMGVGRNMAYTKKLFEDTKGFKSHYSIQSGDDDLFIQEAAHKGNFAIQIHPESYCYSEGESSWVDWKNQKQRHLTTSPHYKVFHKVLLGIYPMSLLLMLITFVSLVFVPSYHFWTATIFVSITIIKWLIQGSNLTKLGEQSLSWSFPLMDWLYAFLMPYIYYSSEKQTKKWK